MMSAGTLLVGLILAAVVGAIIISLVRKKKAGVSSCGCSCSCCPAGEVCSKMKEDKISHLIDGRVG